MRAVPDLSPIRRATPSGEHDLVARVAEALAHFPLDFGGGAGTVKAAVLADLVQREDPSLVVEVGVLHGRALAGLAIGAAASGARVVGVDPWSPTVWDDPRQDHPELGDAIVAFIEATDWDAVHDAARARLDRLGLQRVELLRESSPGAAAHFEDGAIDVLHLDGDHGFEAVGRDLRAWLPKLRDGALLVVDAISWRPVRPYLTALQEVAQQLLVVSDLDALLGLGHSDFAVLRWPGLAALDAIRWPETLP